MSGSQWCLMIYFAMSFITMEVIRPERDERPVVSCVVCFLIGGAVFMIAVAMGIFKIFIRNRDK